MAMVFLRKPLNPVSMQSYGPRWRSEVYLTQLRAVVSVADTCCAARNISLDAAESAGWNRRTVASTLMFLAAQQVSATETTARS